MTLRLPESETEYRNALVEAAELGAKRALTEAGLLKPYLSLKKSYRKYGEAVVKRWIMDGNIHPKQDGPSSKKRIDRLEIESVAKASNRSTYIPAKEWPRETNNQT